MKLFKLRAGLKGCFFLFKLHKLVPSNIFNFLSHFAKLSRWINRQKVPYSDFFTPKRLRHRRFELYQYIIATEKLESNFDYLEFGVASGISFKWWINEIKVDTVKFYGFDTFSGLPEDWGPFKKGDMSSNNKIPVTNDSRCSFFEGVFQQTLPKFLKNYDSKNRKVIHLDADLYSSTLFVLTSISSILKSGDLIFFDEFCVPMHEFKAFDEWTKSFYINYEVLGAVNNFFQICIKIK
jgi:O-methyltransferase